MMRRGGGKRIRMDDPPPDYEELVEQSFGNQMEPSTSEADGNENKSGRMTRLRARGGVPAKPPIIDDDEEETLMVKKRKMPKKAVAEKERVEKVPVEKVTEKFEREKVDKTLKNVDENTLYYIVRNSKSSIASIVDDWIESYKLDRETALIALMQFFINASGCKGKITPQMQSSMEHTAIIRKMTEEFEEESGEYPLIMPGQQWKKFKLNFCDFVQTLVKQCQYSIIYDQFLMDNVISLLTGLSDSQVRAFRHTATLAAMKLMTALVDVALLVSINFDNAARQYDGERMKGRDKRATDRLESLIAKRTELEENMDEIKNMLTYMFKSVFVHRYRDTLPEIRAICMSEIGLWMQKFSQNFLDDSYLKYIGWTLHDKVGEVRLRCLQALLPLYETEELKGKLELFTSKFKDRIVAMTLDKEYDVAVQAVKLVISILKIHQDILTDKDCENVYELVYSSHRGVAQAAAEFLNVRLFFLEKPLIETKTRRGKVRLPNTPLIRDLVQFFIESELHEHGAYLVDSFIENNSMVKDWECMTDLLLEEPGPLEEPLDNKQESTLIEIMVSSIKQSATGESPIGRGNNRKMNLNVKEVKIVQDDKQKLTEHFIQTVPILLEKFSVDNEKLINLLNIPQYFELEIYTTSRQEHNLQALLDKISHIMDINNDREVLETCSKTLELLCTEGSAIYTRCDVARSNIIDIHVNRYKEAIDDWSNLIEGEDIPDEDDIYNVNISLKKILILYACHNLNLWNLFDLLFLNIEQFPSLAPDNKGIPTEALASSIGACYLYLVWEYQNCQTFYDSSLAEDKAQELKQNLIRFVNVCNIMISSGPTPAVKESAYMAISDLCLIFSEFKSGSAQCKVEYKPDLNQQLLLNKFVQQYAFSSEQEDDQDETKIEELHKRRCFLAAYCKLIVYNVIPTQAASEIFKHYLKFYNDYGDIIKTTVGKTRDTNKTNCALTMFLSLITIFNEIKHKNTRTLKSSQEYIDLKELAKRFALSFGLDAIRNREPITAMHRAGILFASNSGDSIGDSNVSPPNLLFFDILLEFTNKLLKQDKKVILNILDRRMPAAMPSSKSDDWLPLSVYRNSLLHGEFDQAPVTSKRAYSRRRRDNDADDDEHDDYSDQEIHA